MALLGTFVLANNSGSFDQLVCMKDALVESISTITKERAAQGYSGAEVLPTVADIEATHVIVPRNAYKPFVPVSSQYLKVNQTSGNLVWNGTLVYDIPNMGEFIWDAFLNILTNPMQCSASDTLNIGSPAQPYRVVNGQGQTVTQGSGYHNYVYYANNLAHRLFDLHEFDVSNTLIDNYTTDMDTFYMNMRVPLQKLGAYKRCIGQELPVTGYSQTVNFPANGTQGTAPNARNTIEILNGPQTPQYTQPALSLIYPYKFDFCEAPSNAIPILQIQGASRKIKSYISSSDKCLFTTSPYLLETVTSTSGPLTTSETAEIENYEAGEATLAPISVTGITLNTLATPFIATAATANTTALQIGTVVLIAGATNNTTQLNGYHSVTSINPGVNFTFQVVTTTYVTPVTGTITWTLSGEAVTTLTASGATISAVTNDELTTYGIGKGASIVVSGASQSRLNGTQNNIISGIKQITYQVTPSYISPDPSGAIAWTAGGAMTATNLPTNASTYTVTATTASTSGITNGNTVTIAGATGTGAASVNGNQTVANVTPGGFTYTVPNYPLDSNASLRINSTVVSITSLSVTANIVTAFSSNTSILVGGTSVTISGSSVSALNGTFTILSLTSNVSFTYNAVTGNTTDNTPGITATGTARTIISINMLNGSTAQVATGVAQTTTIGNQFVVSGSTVSAYNGTKTITGIQSSNILDFTVAALYPTPVPGSVTWSETGAITLLAVGNISGPGTYYARASTTQLGFQVGGSITISGAAQSQLNGTFTISATNPGTSFDYPVPDAAWTSPDPSSQITISTVGNYVTALNGTLNGSAYTVVATTPNTTGLSIGSYATVIGSTLGWNGTFQVTNVVIGNSFTYIVPTTMLDGWEYAFMDEEIPEDQKIMVLDPSTIITWSVGSAPTDQIFSNSVSLAPTTVSGSTLNPNLFFSVADLYVNNIFIDSCIHDIYTNRVMFSLTRLHVNFLQPITANKQHIQLSTFKWGLEYLFCGVRQSTLISSALANYSNYAQNWDQFNSPIAAGYVGAQSFTAQTTGTPDYTEVDFGSSVLPPYYYYNNVPLVTDLQFTLQTIDLLNGADGFPSVFYDSYTPFKMGGFSISSNTNAPGLMMVNFSFAPGSKNPYGYMNISRAREFYAIPKLSTQGLTLLGSMQFVACGLALNFLYISSGNLSIRFN